MDTKKTDLIIQYVMSLACQNDFGDRELGPIHIIKYLYLADLVNAQENNGEIYTGIRWRFYHFGPWAEEAFSRIDPALAEINAEKKTICSKFQDDFTRWNFDDVELAERLEDRIPIWISGAIRNYVRRFSSDTYSLLDFVYKTPPMLTAAPNEYLDFSCVILAKPSLPQLASPQVLSKKQEKRLNAVMADARVELKKRLAMKKKHLAKPQQHDSLDEAFYAIEKMLDSEAGEKIEPQKLTVRISNGVWKSKARYDPDIQ